MKGKPVLSRLRFSTISSGMLPLLVFCGIIASLAQK